MKKSRKYARLKQSDRVRRRRGSALTCSKDSSSSKKYLKWGNSRILIGHSLGLGDSSTPFSRARLSFSALVPKCDTDRFRETARDSEIPCTGIESWTKINFSGTFSDPLALGVSSKTMHFRTCQLSLGQDSTLTTSQLGSLRTFDHLEILQTRTFFKGSWKWVLRGNSSRKNRQKRRRLRDCRLSKYRRFIVKRRRGHKIWNRHRVLCVKKTSQ